MDDCYIDPLLMGVKVKELLNLVESCYRVFSCRYKNNNGREALHVLDKIFKEVLGLINKILSNVRQLITHKLAAPCGRLNCDCIAKYFTGKSDVYNNLTLLMHQAATDNSSTISTDWTNAINIALTSDSLQNST